MQPILLIGGPGTGKTTLAKELVKRIPNAEYYYGSRYGVRIPMTLVATSKPDLLSLSKEQYLQTILQHKDISTMTFSREAMDAFGEQLFQRYGNSILAEVTHTVRDKNRVTIIDNSARQGNVGYHKKKGVFIVGLFCSLETQLQRRKAEARDIDFKDEDALRKDILRSMHYFEMDKILKLADVVYDTDIRETEDIADDVLKRIRKN